MRRSDASSFAGAVDARGGRRADDVRANRPPPPPPDPQMQSHELSAASDVWAMAMLLWEMMTESKPWDGLYPDFAQLREAVCRGERVQIPPSAAAAYPVGYIAVVKAGTSFTVFIPPRTPRLTPSHPARPPVTPHLPNSCSLGPRFPAQPVVPFSCRNFPLLIHSKPPSPAYSPPAHLLCLSGCSC